MRNADPTTESLNLDKAEPTASPQHGFFERLYTGTGGFPIVSRRKFFYTMSAVLLLISILSIAVRGFTLGIDFEGGSRIQVPALANVSTQDVEDTYAQTLGHGPVTVQEVGSGSAATIQVRSETLDGDQTAQLTTALRAMLEKESKTSVGLDAISIAEISETWGGQITQKALIALAVFVALTMIYIAIRFERDMSIAAIVSLFFNLIVTAGIYSLVGFEVTPAAVIGLLTILGYVLYDNVVVFDKVEENTRGVLHLHKRTYAEQANLAANQTLMRSISTTVIGILPIIGMLVIAVWMLGVGTLKDLALVQLVGMIVGAYSSIFLAVPVLVSIKERWGPVAAHTKKVLDKRAGVGTTPVPVTAGARAARGPRPTDAGAPRPGARPSGKRNKGRH
ncbi:protein translocase subunit SecF [Nocardia sp. NPDC050378]|uniref:protein translocase subunit SecF n=1 Tax=Nocardia sp. NPDC050378 TaxID=3155400 RepID=UPI00340FFE43